MDARSKFDPLDLVAGVAGLIIAVAVLRSGADHGTERLVVVVCVAGAVALKRIIVRSRNARTEGAVSVRICYLFLACIGTVCVASALLVTFAGLREVAGAGIYLAGGGAALLILAAIIDWLFLEARD